MKRIVLIITVISLLLGFSSHSAWAFSIEWGPPEGLNDEFKDAEVVADHLQEKIDFIKHKNKVLTNQLNKLTDTFLSLSTAADALKAENKDLAERATALETLITSLEKDTLHLDRRAAALEDTADDLKGKNLDLTIRTSTLNVTSSTLQAQAAGLETRTAGYQAFFDHVTLDPEDINGLRGPHVIFTGVNVHIRSGLGFTEDPGSGLGNLIVGYNEDLFGSSRTGSHNLVVGAGHGYSSWGGFVAGVGNTISGPYASVSGGAENTAGGYASSVSGGRWLEAGEDYGYAPRRDAAQ